MNVKLFLMLSKKNKKTDQLRAVLYFKVMLLFFTTSLLLKSHSNDFFIIVWLFCSSKSFSIDVNIHWDNHRHSSDDFFNFGFE